MRYQELLELIKVGEGYTLEFKESINTSTLGKIKIPKQIRSKSEANPKQIQSKDNTGKKLKNTSKQRIEWILEYLNKNNSIKSSIIEEKFNIHRDTAISDLKKIDDKIVKKGAGNNIWYELKEK